MSESGYTPQAYAGVAAGETSYASRQDSGSQFASTYDSRSFVSTDYTTTIPDDMQLNYLCSNAFAPRNSSEAAREESEESWEPVRDWLRTHPGERVREAAEQRGEGNMTALHFACRNGPPSDVIDVFLSIAAETVQWPDTFGWLPIHYACACNADTIVIKKLAEAFPESKTTVDRRGRTPLHFSLGTSGPGDNQTASPAVIAVLSSTGAAAFADDNGMLPLHYACAYGASEESLLVLTKVHPDAITAIDSRFRTPLHFALSNGGNAASPGAVRHLLRLDPKLVNATNRSTLPLRVLAEFSNTLKKTEDDREKREHVMKCLEHLLNANPDPTADFLTALQSLPDWLSERAVVMPNVQIILNDKIAQRFPTGVLILDFYFLSLVIVFYSFAVIDSLNKRFDDDPNVDRKVETWKLIPLYVGVAYFSIRELLSVVSLFALRSVHIWIADVSNWLNIIYIVLVLYYTLLMDFAAGDDYRFRTGAALTVIILWLKVLSFLRNMLIEFAVFAGGVFYVVQRLVAFLISLGVILVAFAQMFLTVFQQSSICNAQEENGERDIDEIRCEIENEFSFPYCDFWSSFLSVYTMLLGEVDETLFTSSLFATILFILFMFLVVILLANVLIAIVTDSYKVIQDERAAIVFWTNRLNFIAQMDAIVFRGKQVKRQIGVGGHDDDDAYMSKEATFGSEFWKRLVYLFEDDVDDGILSVEFWVYLFLRILTAVIIMPLWILLGLVTAGWLWPPQVREAIFTSTVSQHSSETAKEDELRKTQVAKLQEEVKILRDDLEQEMAVDRTEVVQMKSAVAERKADIASEMRHIKRLMTMLFEQQTNFDS